MWRDSQRGRHYRRNPTSDRTKGINQWYMKGARFGHVCRRISHCLAATDRQKRRELPTYLYLMTPLRHWKRRHCYFVRDLFPPSSTPSSRGVLINFHGIRRYAQTPFRFRRESRLDCLYTDCSWSMFLLGVFVEIKTSRVVSTGRRSEAATQLAFPLRFNSRALFSRSVSRLRTLFPRCSTNDTERIVAWYQTVYRGGIREIGKFPWGTFEVSSPREQCRTF